MKAIEAVDAAKGALTFGGHVATAAGIFTTVVLAGSVALVVYSVATEDPKIFEGLDQTYNWYDYP